MTAVWNITKSLAQTGWNDSLHGNKRRRLAKQEDADFSQYEDIQLDWKPEPGKRPYAGRDDD
jgi:hypothetical protein